MRIGTQWLTLALASALGLAVTACAGDHSSTTQRTRHLNDADHDGLLEEFVVAANPGGGGSDDQGPIIMPEPGNCPVMEWTETHTVKTDGDGNVIEETWQVCTQCYEEDGQTPIGDQQCFDQPPLPPDVICEQVPGGDDGGAGGGGGMEPWPGQPDDPTMPPTGGGGSCYVCRAADGTIVEEGCSEPDPCVPVPGLPGDPTGQSCWSCVDPMTGQDIGSWCDVHTCNADGSCENPWEQCDAATGLCTWVDPCQPVPSLPEDPTGQDCYVCTYPDDPMPVPPPDDPAGGMNGGAPGAGTTTGWCNVHTCNADADCPAGEACNAGLCEWVDPCVPVPPPPGDPNAPTCYTCTDPMTGEGWGWCDGEPQPGEPGGPGCGDGSGGMDPGAPPAPMPLRAAVRVSRAAR